jgi:hypothetical protein
LSIHQRKLSRSTWRSTPLTFCRRTHNCGASTPPAALCSQCRQRPRISRS